APAPACDAIGRFVRSPGRSLPFLRDHLLPVKRVEPEEIARLIVELDNERFAVREEATRALARAEEQAVAALAKAVRGPPREVRKRARQLLNRLKASIPPPDKLRALRAAEVLEYIGSPEAKKLLQAIGRGAPEARLTMEANVALSRLEKRPVR